MMDNTFKSPSHGIGLKAWSKPELDTMEQVSIPNASIEEAIGGW